MVKETDATQAAKMLRKYYGANVQLHKSSRQHKKYMVQAPDGKWVHFGQRGYEDYTAHKDKVRRQQFRTRNAHWAHAAKWTPAHLAYWVLW